MPLCDFIKTYHKRLITIFNQNSSIISNHLNYFDQIKVPSLELLKICIEQIQACEIDKFRNLNKLAILINVIGSLLRITSCINDSDKSSCFTVNNSKLTIQLTKNLVQVI